MNYGFIRTAAVTPKVKVADTTFNLEEILKNLEEAFHEGAKIIVFPELCLTGYTCQDLFFQSTLQKGAVNALKEIISFSKEKEALVFVGLPWEYMGKLYNASAAICNGKLLGIIPKTSIPNYSEFYEARYFVPGMGSIVMVDFEDKDENRYQVPFGTDQLFRCTSIPGLIVGAEICEDLWGPQPPSIRHCLAGATVIVNNSASDEGAGKDRYRRNLVIGQSERLVCGYLYANAGEGESTQDLVFGGHNLIGENGRCLAESQRFQSGIIYGDIDLEKLASERRRVTTYGPMDSSGYHFIDFLLKEEKFELKRWIDPSPFIPKDKEERAKRCEEILSFQAYGLKKRLEHTSCTTAVIGISGGLDSTLALLVIGKAFDLLQIPRKQILSVTMPCFGTTDRTYKNACLLTNKMGAKLREIPIRESVLQHFKDIGHDENVHDITYENAQARERTQVLMDIANGTGGMVIGTGDMSELALGWATYNGDHMSMYGVNASVPKTLVRHLVEYYAETAEDKELSEVLYDILDTPVSPELLPPSKSGEIMQKTEDSVGPYELHDFFLYQIMRYGFDPSKICWMAEKAFKGNYDREVILKWLNVFYKRFFSQHFKRSCLPDGPKVGTVALSPRGDLRMPSDAVVRIWIEELSKVK